MKVEVEESMQLGRGIRLDHRIKHFLALQIVKSSLQILHY